MSDTPYSPYGGWKGLWGAPQDGTLIEGLYDEGPCLIRWAETRRCMLAGIGGGNGYFGPGWEDDYNGLIVDPPMAWRPEGWEDPELTAANARIAELEGENERLRDILKSQDDELDQLRESKLWLDEIATANGCGHADQALVSCVRQNADDAAELARLKAEGGGSKLIERDSEIRILKRCLAYLASCNAATLEGLPKSFPKSGRKRFANLCKTSVGFLNGTETPYQHWHQDDVEAAIERCTQAISKYSELPPAPLPTPHKAGGEGEKAND